MIALSAQARTRALRQLAEAHPDEFTQLLRAARADLGLPPDIDPGFRTRVARAPVSPVIAALRPQHIRERLNITGSAWHDWVKRGVPEHRADDIAAATGIPVDILWPGWRTPTPPGKTPAPPRPLRPGHRCMCGQTFTSRADLANHRRSEGHYPEDDKVAV